MDFYIERLQMENFRQFSDATFELNKGMNVLIGANGSGKTSVIEAVAVMLGAYLAAYKRYVPSRFVYNLKASDAMLKPLKQLDTNSLQRPDISQYPCKISCDMQFAGGLISYTRMIEKEEARTKFNGKNPMQPLVAEWESALMAGDGSDNNIILPLVLYLSSARLWSENNQQDEIIPKRTDAYKNCLDKKRGSQFAFGYIKNLVDVSAQERDGSQFDSYKVIMDAIHRAMSEELQEGCTVEYSSRFAGKIVKKNKDGTLIPFECLSDGYRNVIKTVADIACRMCILNPHLGKEALDKTPGVVLIDELDLSLHPNWQKRIVKILVDVFPRVQFVTTTHSPFIIQSLKSGELISMEEGVSQTQFAGESIEDIAESIMDVVIPQWSRHKIDMYKESKEFFEKLQQLDKNDTAARQALREKLVLNSARYSDDPAFVAFLQTKYDVRMAEMGFPCDL